MATIRGRGRGREKGGGDRGGARRTRRCGGRGEPSGRGQFCGAEYAFHATVISVLQKTEGAGGGRKAISASDNARGGWRERNSSKRKKMMR